MIVVFDLIIIRKSSNFNVDKKKERTLKARSIMGNLY